MLPMPTDQFVDPTKMSQPDKENPILTQTGEEVSDYMHQLDGKGHALLDTSTASVKYDEYAHKWKAQEFPTMTNDSNIDYYDLYQDCFEIRDSLIATINKFRSAHGQDLFIESKPETRAGVQEAVHRFHDLLRSRSNSLDETNSAERLRKAYDNPTDDSFDFISFLSKYTPSRFLLTSVLCAGLKTLLAAMRVNMYQACPLRKILEELPGILNRPTSFIEVLGADEEFHRKISAVYSCVLKLLRVSLKLFVGSTDSSRLEKLVDRVAMLKMRAKKLHSYASSVSYLKLKELQVLQERNLFVSSLSLRAQDELKQRLDETLQRVMALEGLKEILIDDRRRDLEQLRAKTPDRPEHEGGDVDEAQKELPTKVTQERAIDTAVGKSSENAPDEGPTIQQILELLEYDPAIMPSDCSKLLRIQPMSAGLKSSRMLYVVNNIRLRAWLEVDESSLLLINGGGDSSPISEVSYITARLAESFITVARPAKQIMAMAYFCGQHRHTGSDVYASPTEMGMNLLCQLIDNGKEFFASEIVLDVLDGLEPSEMATICNSIERLLALLRNSVVVFLVIEGLNFFSYPASRQAETRELLGRLISIQRRTESATIKLLFTCPSRVLFLEDMIGSSEIMTVPRSPPDLGVWKDSAFSKLFDEVLSDPDDSSDDSQDESSESTTENSLK
ncbi:unnamed protein product [Clonostachys solani]|uniref:Uncharacterized protein n=1 Tax=Clonostachys solani TaxID=160281 RepID=A0A9N9WBW5_9HYPO|nr:unnamed protein product [Clonostachys solani]